MRNNFSKNYLLMILALIILLGAQGLCEAYFPVKVVGRRLMADFDRDGRYEPYLVKGIGYAPYPVGSFPSEWGLCFYEGEKSNTPQFKCDGNLYSNPDILRRDFPYLKGLNVTTIRTWGKVTKELLDIAEENGINVIAGFWIGHDLDFTDNKVKRQIELEFIDYVKEFKNHPSVFMWGLSNENDIAFCSCCKENCSVDIQAKAFYSMINEMAKKARKIEAASRHPIILVSSSMDKLGRDNIWTTDERLSNIDIHGLNAYMGKGFGLKDNNLFKQFQARSQKPLLITEFGADAWYVINPANPQEGVERQDLQSENIVNAWQKIVSEYKEIPGSNIGGIVFLYSDFWWGHDGSWKESAAKHDYGYAPNWRGGQPDGFVNEEWWGLMSIAPNEIKGEVDHVTPREAYYSLKEVFGQLE